MLNPSGNGARSTPEPWRGGDRRRVRDGRHRRAPGARVPARAAGTCGSHVTGALAGGRTAVAALCGGCSSCAAASVLRPLGAGRIGSEIVAVPLAAFAALGRNASASAGIRRGRRHGARWWNGRRACAGHWRRWTGRRPAAETSLPAGRRATCGSTTAARSPISLAMDGELCETFSIETSTPAAFISLDTSPFCSGQRQRDNGSVGTGAGRTA